MAEDSSSGAFGASRQEAQRLNAELARLRREAQQLVQQEGELTKSRGRVRQRLEDEVRGGRVRGDSVLTEEQAARSSRRGQNVQQEAQAQRQAAQAQAQRLRGTRSEQQALSNLTRTREADLRTLQRINRLGYYPVSRNLAEQQLQAQRLANIRASAQTGVTPIIPAAGGGGAGGAAGGGAYGGGRGGGGRPPTDYYRQSAIEVARLRQQQSQWIQTMNGGNQTIRRHGALTTEFFQEAARGTVTIRELGFQTAATIGKFGGWLTAGAALFGALAIVQNFSRGMLDASSGVNDVQRVLNNVNTSRLREQFSDLSEHFNVPIADSAEAVYQMAKVFKDQDDAAQAAKTSLYAVKIGELDVATATRYFTAIVHGANLTVGDMSSLMDQVNQAQNNFGVSIEGTLAGLAKATGSYRNLGGNVQRYLLPLIAASQFLTGQTGDVAGTAFQRIPNFLAKPNNQATLKQYGINPDANIDAILNKALKLSGSGKLDEKQLRQIAFSIFGTFYGPRIGLPLLQNPEQVRNLQRGTSPEASRGSAERELDKLLGSIQERIVKIGIELQRLGDEAVDTGLLDFFGLTVTTIGEVLKLTTALTADFNNLPEGVRKTLTYALQLMIAMRLMQRFRVGELIVPPGQAGQYGAARNALAQSLGTADSPRVGSRLARKAIADEAKFFEEQRSAEFRNAALANTRAQIASQKLAEGKTEYQRLKDGEADQKAVVAQKSRNIALEQEYNRALESEAAAQVSAESHNQQLLAAQERQAKTGRRFRNLIFGRNYQRDIQAQEGRFLAAAGPGVRPEQVLTPQQQAGRQAAREAVAQGRALGVMVGGTREDIERIRSENNKLAAQTQRSRTSSTILQRAGSRFSRGVSGFLGMAGNLFFAAAIGATAGELIAAVFDGLGKKYDATIASLESADQSAEGLRSRLPQLQDRETTGGALGQTLDDLAGKVFGASSPSDLAGQEHDRLNQILYLQNRQRQINRGITPGQAGPIQFLGREDLEERIRGLKKVGNDGKEFNQRAKRIRAEIKSSGLPEEEINALIGELSRQVTKLSLGLKPSTLRQRLKAISDPKQLQTLLEGYQALQDTGRGGPNVIQNAALVYRRAVRLLGHSKDPEAMKQLAEARKALQEVVQRQVDLIAARGELRGARINEAADPTGKQRVAIQTLQRELQVMLANKEAYDIKDILGIRAQIADARIQLAETIRQQAEELAQARFDVARARAGGNEVRLAKIDIQQAQHDIGQARTPAERLQARADLINSRRTLREEIANREIEDIEFQSDIGKLTLDQQVSAYRRLLKTAELTRDQRRDLKRRIAQLKHEQEGEAGGFELDVGHIKLPTIYEIRRAIGGGGGSQVSVTNAPNVYVNVANAGDAQTVGQQIDQTLGTSTKAAMRSAGIS